MHRVDLRRAIAFLGATLMLAGEPLAVLAQSFPAAAQRAEGHGVTPADAPPAAAPADTTPQSAAPLDPEQSLAQSRELIKAGEYDQAIELLRAVIERLKPKPEVLRQAYLLLIKTHVYEGNNLRQQPQGRSASELEFKEAKRLIAECLGIRELRHTTPEPEIEYPPNMIDFFREIRGRTLGAIRVSSIAPPTAVVIVDGDTLRSARGSPLEDLDVPVGEHVVLVRAAGYVPEADPVQVSPGSTLERSYTLRKQRTPWWYAWRVGAGVVGLGALVAIGYASRSTPNTSGPGVLPAPRLPPGH